MNKSLRDSWTILEFPYLAGIEFDLFNISAKFKLTVELFPKIIADFYDLTLYFCLFLAYQKIYIYIVK